MPAKQRALYAVAGLLAGWFALVGPPPDTNPWLVCSVTLLAMFMTTSAFLLILMFVFNKSLENESFGQTLCRQRPGICLYYAGVTVVFLIFLVVFCRGGYQ